MNHVGSGLARACIVSALLTIASACSGGDDEPTVTPPPDVARDQHLRVWLQYAPGSFDPHLATFAEDISVMNQMFRGLLWYDEDLNIVPMAAKDVPSVKNGGISSDGLVYRFELRDGLKWSDGQPLTAMDFEYSFKRLLDPAIGASYASFYFDITGAEAYNTASPESGGATLAGLREEVGVKAMGASTLIFTLKSPRATFLHLMTFSAAGPVRQDVIEEFGGEWTAPLNFVGSGPFVLSEVSESELVLVPNRNWWSEEPRLGRLTFRIIEDPVEAFNAYLAGELDYVGVPPSQEYVALVDADPQLKRQNQTLSQLASFALIFNNTVPPFDRPEVREAFSLAIDREAIIAAFVPNGAVAGSSWIPPGMPGYDGKSGTRWKLDPERARKVLAEAGFENGKGIPRIVFFHTDGQTPLAQTLQSQIKEHLGIQVDLQLVDASVSREKQLSGDFQIASYGWFADYLEPDSFLGEPFGCQRYEGGVCMAYANGNDAHYANPEFDRLLQQAGKEFDRGRRLKLYEEAQDVLIEDAPAIFLGHVVRNVLIKPYVRGGTHTALDTIPFQFFLDRVYINR